MTQAAARRPSREPRQPRTTRRPRSSQAVDGPLAPGTRLFGRYRLERSIGRGGSAEVWQAHDERLDRTVAIKILHPHLLPDAASIERFVAEARAAAGLTHPGVVPVFDVVEDPRTPAIVFRFVDGETLAGRIARRGPMPAAEAAAIVADLAGALAHAHHLGLVHRDVKPGNVLVDTDGHVQLVDFGIARALDGADRGDAGSGDADSRQVMGTLRYMAPEQLANRAVDARTDLYALGLVLHELLTGRPAFGSASPAALVDAQRQGPPALPAETPAAVAALVGELLALDPADRPPDASEVEMRLRPFVEAQPVDLKAGLAAPTDVTQAEASAATPADRRGDLAADADTLAFAAPPTATFAVPAAAVTPAAVTPAVVAPAMVVPATAPPAPSRRRAARIRRPSAIAIGGAMAALGALVLALAIVGHGPVPAALTAPGPSATAPLGAAATPPATAAPKTIKPPRGHGHGKHGDTGP